MSHYNNAHFTLQNIENFSLTNEKKIKFFRIYKTIRYNKYINQNYKNNSLTYIISNNIFIISKEINLNFFKKVDLKKNDLINKDNYIKRSSSSINYDLNKHNQILKSKNKKIKYNKNKDNYCKNKKNSLIKPIMFEDTILSNKNINKKFNDNFSCNKYLNNSQKIINFNKKFNLDNLINIEEIQNIYRNIRNKEYTIENKLKEPIFLLDDSESSLQNNKNFLNEIKKSKIINEKELNNKKDKELNNYFDKTKKKQKIFINKKENLTLKKSITQESINIIKSKGRKSKNSQNFNIESKHTKYSSDNMMRKIKNKVIESSRLLINKVLKDEIKNNNLNFKLIYKEFRKIQGSFSQELNIKYNFWFYLITIKDIFGLEISNKYTTIEKSSNKELIDYLFSPLNNNKFIKTKQLLSTPFHQFYHDIFLGEELTWKKYYGINDNDIKYQIDYLLKYLDEDENGEENVENKKYINDINELAHHYEDFFLEKKPRNVDYNNKKNQNQYIKLFMKETPNDKYLQLLEDVKNLKNYYENRNLQKGKLNDLVLMNKKSEETMDNSLIKKKDITNNDIYENKEIKLNKLNTSINSEHPIEDKISKIENNINRINSIKSKNVKENENIKETFDYKNEKNLINLFGNNSEEYIPEEIIFCNKKRNNKMKYFISCKKFKKEENSKIFN